MRWYPRGFDEKVELDPEAECGIAIAPGSLRRHVDGAYRGRRCFLLPFPSLKENCVWLLIGVGVNPECTHCREQD